MQITFHEIVKVYKAQPGARAAVYRAVPLLQDAQLACLQAGNIIQFYNAVFIAAAKHALLAVTSGRMPLSAPPRELSRLSDSAVSDIWHRC